MYNIFMNPIKAASLRYNHLRDHGIIDYYRDATIQKVSQLSQKLRSIPSELKECLIGVPIFIITITASITSCFVIIFSWIDECDKWGIGEVTGGIVGGLILVLFLVVIIGAHILGCIYLVPNYKQERRNLEASGSKAQNHLHLLDSPSGTLALIEASRPQVRPHASDAEVLHFALTGSRAMIKL